jgi:hypothetical protein
MSEYPQTPFEARAALDRLFPEPASILQWDHIPGGDGLSELIRIPAMRGEPDLFVIVDKPFYDGKLSYLHVYAENGDLFTADNQRVADLVAVERMAEFHSAHGWQHDGFLDLRYNFLKLCNQTDALDRPREYATPVDPDDPDGEQAEAWDKPDLSKPVQYDEGVWRALNWVEDDARNRALAALKAERPEDHQWLTEYIAGLHGGKKQGSKASLKDRHKALNIRRWLESRGER